MSKLQEIWSIIRRRDFKDGDEVHAVKFNGGVMLSDELYKTIKPKLEEFEDKPITWREMHGVKIVVTRHLPYIYREVDKRGTHAGGGDGE